MTDAKTEGARMVAGCTSGDEAAVREAPSLASQVFVGPLAPLHYAVREKATPASCSSCWSTAPLRTWSWSISAAFH
jgi:hypothetical protein